MLTPSRAAQSSSPSKMWPAALQDEDLNEVVQTEQARGQSWSSAQECEPTVLGWKHQQGQCLSSAKERTNAPGLAKGRDQRKVDGCLLREARKWLTFLAYSCTDFVHYPPPAILRTRTSYLVPSNRAFRGALIVFSCAFKQGLLVSLEKRSSRVPSNKIFSCAFPFRTF